MKETLMENTQIHISSVERNKAASALCKRLFPVWSVPPTQGELQRIILEAQDKDATDEQIFKIGNWWLWIRNLAIENTFGKQSQLIIIQFAIRAAVENEHINIVSCRSPELLHAQILGQGDSSLPRSRQALQKLHSLVRESSKFLPTSLTIAFADLAIDNLQEIKKKCCVEKTISENIQRLKEIAQETGLENFKIIKLSELNIGNNISLKDFLHPDGTSKIHVVLDERAEKLIKIAARESFQSHQRMFGWTEEQSLAHNRNLGITMGLVGQAILQSISSAILIHNEAFIARGALNNLFTDPKNPLPVICLKDLLDRKRKRD